MGLSGLWKLIQVESRGSFGTNYLLLKLKKSLLQAVSPNGFVRWGGNLFK